MPEWLLKDARDMVVPFSVQCLSAGSDFFLPKERLLDVLLQFYKGVGNFLPCVVGCCGVLN